jgi:23S rRNA pseudouridine1911/1915/1917 synthase
MKDPEIVFENNDFIVLNKPSGLTVHPDGRTEENTLVDWLKEKTQNPAQENIGNPHTLDSGRYVSRWGVVNRLDKETSGLILVAKNEKTFFELQKLFLEQKVVKKYSALVWGKVDVEKLLEEGKIFKTENKDDSKDMFSIREKITRHKKDPRIWTCGFLSSEGGRSAGREALTFFNVDKYIPVEKYLENESENFLTKINFYPKTGRTHQLRLHSRFLGHPILGDRKYGLNGKINEHSTRQIKDILENLNDKEMKFDTECRLALHAESLQFQLFGEKYFFEAGGFKL